MTVKEILRLLHKLEMEIREGRDTIASFSYEGRLIIRTKVPHKRGELKGKLLHFIRQQLKLNEEEFHRLTQCRLFRADYVELLRKKGKL